MFNGTNNVFGIVLNFSVEHILNLISIAHYTTTCLHDGDPIETFLEVQSSEVFYFLPYSIWLAIVGKLSNVISTFCWNFMDLFVMIVSVGLSSRFKQINEDLQRIKGQVNCIISNDWH